MLDFEHAVSFALEVEQVANVASEILVVGLTKEGIFKFGDTHDGDNTFLRTSFRIPDFPIMLSVTSLDTTVDRGEYYVNVYLTMNGERVAKLVGGYVSRNESLTWPGVQNQSVFERPGVVRTVTGTDRAANTEITETVPTGVAWLLHAITFTLVADANAATREVQVQITDGTSVLMRFPASGTQAATETRAYFFMRRGARESAAGGGDRAGDLPQDIILPAGFTIETQTDNMQVGDNYGAPILTVEEFKVASS